MFLVSDSYRSTLSTVLRAFQPYWGTFITFPLYTQILFGGIGLFAVYLICLLIFQKEPDRSKSKASRPQTRLSVPKNETCWWKWSLFSEEVATVNEKASPDQALGKKGASVQITPRRTRGREAALKLNKTDKNSSPTPFGRQPSSSVSRKQSKADPSATENEITTPRLTRKKKSSKKNASPVQGRVVKRKAASPKPRRTATSSSVTRSSSRRAK